MYNRLNELQSLLQVHLRDKPEHQYGTVDLVFFEDHDEISFTRDELTLANGHALSDSYYGENVTLRFAACISNGGDILYSMPEGPVVSFHFGMLNDLYGKFERARDRSLWCENSTSLFWQNRKIITYELSPGNTKCLDLFFRPELFLEMADRHPILRELALEVKTANFGSLDFFVGVGDSDFNALVEDIVDELDRLGMYKERFQYVSECLLLRSMGVFIPFQSEEELMADQFPVSAEKENELEAEDPPWYCYTEEQQQLFDKLQHFNKTELKVMFYEERLEYFENKKSREEFRGLLTKLKARYFEIMGDTVEVLADAYFWMAECLDKHAANYSLNDEEMKIVAEAIVMVCDQSFELRIPPPAHLALYTKWTKKPYAQDIEFSEFTRLLHEFMPEFDIDLSHLNDSKESQAIFSEYIQDKFGFKPLSYYTGEQEKDKPKEVVELYHMLMENLTDEFTITADGEIKKSDVIRILDFAYEMDDLIPMLLIEIEHFSKSRTYVNKQSLEKICMWMLAMAEGNHDLIELVIADRKDPLYRLIDIYERSPQKIKAVEKHARKSKDIYEKLAPALLDVGVKMQDRNDKGIFLVLVKSVIIAGENPDQ